MAAGQWTPDHGQQQTVTTVRRRAAGEPPSPTAELTAWATSIPDMHGTWVCGPCTRSELRMLAPAMADNLDTAVDPVPALFSFLRTKPCRHRSHGTADLKQDAVHGTSVEGPASNAINNQ